MTNFTDATPDSHHSVQRGTSQQAKTLTFVVPAYNMEQYLERCVASLIDTPDTGDIEVLIVDDGSSDTTPELADRLQAAHPDVVRAIHQPNKGHGGAVNTGIREARNASNGSPSTCWSPITSMTRLANATSMLYISATSWMRTVGSAGTICGISVSRST